MSVLTYLVPKEPIRFYKSSTLSGEPLLLLCKADFEGKELAVLQELGGKSFSITLTDFLENYTQAGPDVKVGEISMNKIHAFFSTKEETMYKFVCRKLDANAPVKTMGQYIDINLQTVKEVVTAMGMEKDWKATVAEVIKNNPRRQHKRYN